MPRLPEVRSCSVGAGGAPQSDFQAMAIQRMGYGHDRASQPPTCKGHKWILAATDYFTKWVEAVPMRNVTANDVVNFVKEHIIYYFGIPQTITTDQGFVFLAEEFKKIIEEMGITLI